MITIEYDSSNGSPMYYVYHGNKYVGWIEDETSLVFMSRPTFQEQIDILQALVKTLETKPLTKENYE